MPEQLTNALVTPSATLASASITAGTTTAFDVTWNEPSPPSSGTYSLLFKGDAADGSDDSIFRVATMSDSDSIATGSWEKVGAQAVFTAGSEIELDHSKAALEATLATKLDTTALDTDGTLAANSDAKVATQKATKTYADTMLPKAGGTMTGPLLGPAGSASAPSQAVRSSNIGIFSPGANLGAFAASNTELLRWQWAQIRLFTRLNVEKQIALPDTTTLYLSGTGDDYTVTSSDSAGIAVTTFGAGSNIYLPSTPTGVLYVIGLDPYATDPVTVASLYTLNPGEAAGFWYSSNLSNYMKIGA